MNLIENFRVAHIWTELDNERKTVHKIMLQKWDISMPSWWTPHQPQPPLARHAGPNWTLTPGTNYEEYCQYCAQLSVRIYRECWLCLDNNCDRLFTQNGHRNRAPDSLTFNPEFLRRRVRVNDGFVAAYDLTSNTMDELQNIQHTGQVGQDRW